MWCRRIGRLLYGPCLLPLWLGLLTTGCNASRLLIASPGDYADYRRVRLASTYDERMAAAWEYLQRRPDGRYYKRLRRYFKKAEPVYYKVRMRNVTGLSAYLRALPNGPHAKEALALLGVRNYERRRKPRDTQAARVTRLRLDARKTSRKSAAALLQWWVLALSEQSVWRQPWSRLPQAALIRYRLSSPAPVCEPQGDGQVCNKPMRRHFIVTGEKGRTERTLTINMQVSLDEWYHPRGVTFAGPHMLLRSWEARGNQALDESDMGVRRNVANDLSRELVAALFRGNLICNGDTEVSGVTVLDCERLRITIRPAFDGGDDVVSLTRLTDAANAAVAPAAAAKEGDPYE